MLYDMEKDEKQAFSERLNDALDAINFPAKHAGRQTQLAKDMGVSQKGARKWLEGEAIPAQENLMKLTRLAKVGLDWLATGRPEGQRDSSYYNTSSLPASHYVPVISWIRAGAMDDIEIVQEPESGEWPEVRVDGRVGNRAWALRVEGDSMDDGTPTGIREGSTIICDPDLAPHANAYVIAKDTTTQQATFKKLVTDGGRWYLKPLNRAYPTIEIDDPQLRVIAVVVEAQPPALKLN